MTPEGKVKKEVREFLDSLGPACWYYMPVPMGYGRRGVPDFIGCYHGASFAVETKRKSEKAKVWQERELQAMKAAGAQVFLISDHIAMAEFIMLMSAVHQYALQSRS